MKEFDNIWKFELTTFENAVSRTQQVTLLEIKDCYRNAELIGPLLWEF